MRGPRTPPRTTEPAVEDNREETDREVIHRVIIVELVKGVLTSASHRPKSAAIERPAAATRWGWCVRSSSCSKTPDVSPLPTLR